jgi:hypothetical protein
MTAPPRPSRTSGSKQSADFNMTWLQVVLHYVIMSHTLTIRLTEELLAWLKESSRRTGIPVGRLIRQQLETARSQGGTQRFLRHAGAITGGPADVSSRKGFSRS